MQFLKACPKKASRWRISVGLKEHSTSAMPGSFLHKNRFKRYAINLGYLDIRYAVKGQLESF